MEEFLLHWCYSLFELLTIYSLSIGFTKQLNHSTMIRGFLYLIPASLLTVYFEYYLLSSTNSLVLNLTVTYIYILLLLKKKPMVSIFIFLLSFATIMLLQALILLLFTIIALPSDIPVELLGNIITLLLAVLISITKFPSKLYHFIITKSLPIIAALISLSVIAFILNLYNKMNPDNYADLINSIFFPFVAIAYMSIIFIKEYLNQKQEEKRYAIHEAYLPVIEEMIDQIRKRQHQYDNEMQTIKGLALSCNDYATLKEALISYSGYLDTTQVDTKLLKLNHKYLAALLYQKINQSKALNVILDVDISSPILYTKVPEYELVEIAGILIDNMIEATPRQAKCKLSIGTKNNTVIITTINPCSPISQKSSSLLFTRGYTTKSNKDHSHGYGLHTLSEIVKKYEGKIFVENVLLDNIPQLLIEVQL